MPGMIRAVPGVNTIYATFQATLHLEPPHGLRDPRYAHQRRNLIDLDRDWTWRDGRWPTRSGFIGGADGGGGVGGDDLGAALSGNFQPWLTGVGGHAGLKFIIGRCVDSDGNGVSGATVQGFRTADDLFERETTADSLGYYELGTQWAGLAHYLVAYRAGAPDITGTTVNTLTPTNRDGT